jgi:hypothetical protein
MLVAWSLENRLEYKEVERSMPVISMFYGIIVMMYSFDDKQHHLPHIHVEYGEESAVLAIPSGEVLSGSVRSSRLKLVQAWIEIHKEDLIADWKLAVAGEPVFKIDPLR